MNTFRIIGAFLLLAGAAACLYYFTLDVTVAVPRVEFLGTQMGGGRVANLSLMNERQSGLTLGVGGMIVGTLLLLIGEATGKKK